MADRDRLHSLDAVRAFALLAGIVLHASMSFFPLTGGTPWLVVDNSQSSIPQGMFYVIHIFRMATFYFIAGFFAHMAFHRKGAAGFLRDRAKRILVPLLVGWATMGPLVVLALILGIKLSGGEAPHAAELPELDFPLFHLWFLYYLLMLYAIILLIRWGFVKLLDADGRIRNRIDGWLCQWVQGYGTSLILAAPLIACLYFTRNWILWLGIPTPDMSLTPQIPALVGYGTALAFGWLLHRQIDLLQVWKKRWPLHLAVAVAATVFSYRMVVSASDPTSEVPDFLKLTYAVCYCLAIWNWVFAIVGMALRFFSGSSAVRRYVSDSSYWLYLTHLPLVMALQAVVMQWNLHWSVKFLLVVTVATGLLLLSYHYLVRFTYIGEVLNGRRRRRSGTVRIAEGRPPVVSRAADPQSPIVAELSRVHKRYGDTVALDGVDLQVPRGNLFAILGPNGAGKTTAISLLLGLLEPDAGDAKLFGQSPQIIEVRRLIGVMMQEVNLANELRARELIDLTASYYPAPMTNEEVIELTRISSLAGRPYGKLSGGQKRQVQFAMALVGRPRLLFLDEPTAGLDVQARGIMWDLLRRLVTDGTSIVLTTHYLEEAEALADRVAVLNKGRLVALGSVNDVRSLVARKQIRCSTTISAERIKGWPGVQNVGRVREQLHITAMDAEALVRRLLQEDAYLRDLEVSRAGLTEAFTEITQETTP
jgi:ABC-type multidrug transport system ATPase subunit/peptidoglycan/LPS O-acetylase OafA/YrhL